MGMRFRARRVIVKTPRRQTQRRRLESGDEADAVFEETAKGDDYGS